MEELNNFCKEAVSTLDVNENSYIINPNSINISDPIEKAISRYKFHPSILIITDKIVNQDKFSFKPISKLNIKKEVQLINLKKAGARDTIPTKILKICSEVSADALQNFFNMLKLEIFLTICSLLTSPQFLKRKILCTNYRPVSVLPGISKVFEKLMQKQISGYISNFLSPYLCWYRRGFSSQQDPLSYIENRKKVLDKQGFGEAVSLDLSKVFDTIKHDLLIAKLYAHCFNKESLKLFHIPQLLEQ